MTAEPSAVVRRLVDRVYGGRDWTALGALVDEKACDAVRDCARVLALLAAFPDARLTVQDLLSDAGPAGAGRRAGTGTVAARLRLRGTQLGPLAGLPPTGRPADLSLYGVYRLDGGRIAEAYQGWDERALRAQLGTGEAEPVLELDEIQGNVFPGFNKGHLAVLGFRIADPHAAAGALGRLAGQVASGAEVYAFNRLFAEARKRRDAAGTVHATWVNAALSYPALRVLAPDADRLGDAAFRAGMPAGGAVPDLLVVVASDLAAAVGPEAERLTALVAPGFVRLFDQRGDALPGTRREHEHFGFRDGVAQPGVRGRMPAAPHEPVTTPKPGQAMVWPGEFVLGYPGQHATDAPRPGAVSGDGGPEWARNGSFLVFGRFRQHVGAFNRFVRDTTARLGATEPALAGLTEERFAAMLVGRWRSGAPLVTAPEADDVALATGEHADDFRYAADPDALVCPYAAHIRKANLRDDVPAGGEPAEVLRHRMLRRGIPYGPPGDDDATDRGLLFLSYQTSIERQFAFVLEHWLFAPGLRAPGEGTDLIVSDPAGGTGAFGIRVRDGARIRTITVTPDEPFTVLTGGGYFFAPSIGALRQLAAHQGRNQ